jgi:hypothetical protein
MKLVDFFKFEPLNTLKNRMGIPTDVYGSIAFEVEPGRLTLARQALLRPSQGRRAARCPGAGAKAGTRDARGRLHPARRVSQTMVVGAIIVLLIYGFVAGRRRAI